MAYQYDDLVGTGQTYTTLQSWLAARNIAEAWTGNRRCRLKAQLFSDSNYAITNLDTSDSWWVEVTADFGAEHDGRAHEVSGAGNARFSNASNDRPYRVDTTKRVDVSWIEWNSQKAAGVNSQIFDWELAGGFFHHNIVRSNASNAYRSSGFYCQAFNASNPVHVYRNIFYGAFNYAAVDVAGNNVSFLYNTIGASNLTEPAVNCFSVSPGGNTNIKNNAVFPEVGLCYSLDGDANRLNNASDDASGSIGLQNLVATNQFKTYNIVTLTATDLRIKDENADIFGVSIDYYTPDVYPEIDVPISDRNMILSSSCNWSLGADDMICAPPSAAQGFFPFIPN